MWRANVLGVIVLGGVSFGVILCGRKVIGDFMRGNCPGVSCPGGIIQEQLSEG